MIGGEKQYGERSDGAGRFVAEFELAVTPHAANVIRSRLETGRMVYNALLTEALKRYDLSRGDT